MYPAVHPDFMAVADNGALLVWIKLSNYRGNEETCGNVESTEYLQISRHPPSAPVLAPG